MYFFVSLLFCFFLQGFSLEILSVDTALRQRDAGNWSQAYRDFQMLSVEHPENVDCLFYSGQLAAWLGKWSESEKWLQDCLKRDAHYLEAVMLLGNVYLYTQKWEKADALFAAHADCLFAEQGLAKSALWQGEYRLAEERYGKILEAHPENTEARLGMARSLSEQQLYREALS